MEFAFNEDQRLFQTTLRDFLSKEHSAEIIRTLWDTETGRSPDLWAKLSELCVPGLLVPENFEGMGMDEIDMVLLMEEAGAAALAEPLISTAAVAVPLLVQLENQDFAAQWLKKIATGEARVAVGHGQSPFVADAHVAELLLLPSGDEIHGVTRDQVELEEQKANDPANKLFRVRWEPGSDTCLAQGDSARSLLNSSFDRGALACAAQLAGVAQAVIDMSAAFAKERKQFGKPIGSFQAVKHHLAGLQVKVEYVKPLVYRAAFSTARNSRHRSRDVSMAKLVAGEAATACAKTGIQVHGAIGYTWEQDLHIWMRRAWSLDLAWGTSEFHQNRVSESILVPGASLGPDHTFDL